MKPATDFSAIRLEGGLVTPELLRAVAATKADRQSPATTCSSAASIAVAETALLAAIAMTSDARNVCFNTEIFIERPHILEWFTKANRSLLHSTAGSPLDHGSNAKTASESVLPRVSAN